MKLYFENSRGERRLIAQPQTQEDVQKVIHEFCENRHFKIYYIRSWMNPKGEKYYDVGSHTEFFIEIE
jgi:hypothetical protein